MSTAAARSWARSAEQWEAHLAVRRRTGALEALVDAIEEAEAMLAVPPPVLLVERRGPGVAPKLSAEAFELARQVYYLQHGTLADCARAIIAAELSDTLNPTTVRERLQTWWAREQWPKRSMASTFAIRDANHDGGLYRSQRQCSGATTGGGPAPAGKPCDHSALPDSDYCFHHDPRPEYVERRRRQVERLCAGRAARMVPLEPFQRWCARERQRLIADAKARGRVHPNATGWALLADAIGVDQSTLGRLMQGKNSTAGSPPVTRIKVATVIRYLEPLGLTFRDVYGVDPPVIGSDPGLMCPGCGGAKRSPSKTCRACFDASQGAPCSYVNRRGKRCGVPTAHESGVCSKCRQITERVPRPRTGRKSSLTTPMLILALGEYRDLPIIAWVANRMWSVNAGGVRQAYATRKSLTGSLVKHFRKHGWNTTQTAERVYAELVVEHGPVPWPADTAALVEATGMVALAPFAAWLTGRKAQVGTYGALADRTGLNPDRISRWLRAAGDEDADGQATIRRATVDRALEAWGDGTTYADLYRDQP